jgi:hypothetical protein
MTCYWLTSALLGSGLLLQANLLHAQDGAAADLDEARTLFRQAQLLLDGGYTKDACATFERSIAAQPGIGTKFNLADCWERLGRSASAQALFTEVARATREAGQPDRAVLAEQRAQALEAQLSRVQFQPNSDESDLVVQVDGQMISGVALTRPLALDAGKHEIKGERPGHEPWSVQLDVPAGPVLLMLPLPKSVALPAAPSKAAVVAPGAAIVSAPPSSDPAQERGTSSAGPALRYGLLGVGAIGLGVGITMVKQFHDSNERAKDVCPTSRNCSRDEIAQHSQFVDDARGARTWAWVGGSVGGAALLTATLLWLTADDDEEHAAIEPIVGDGVYGALLQGKF